MSFQMYSQTDNSTKKKKIKKLNNAIRLNYTLVDMPSGKVTYDLESKMSLIGLNYNIPITNWLYTGAGMHTAITGDQGGLFTLGVHLGINKKTALTIIEVFYNN